MPACGDAGVCGYTSCGLRPVVRGNLWLVVYVYQKKICVPLINDCGVVCLCEF